MRFNYGGRRSVGAGWVKSLRVSLALAATERRPPLAEIAWSRERIFHENHWQIYLAAAGGGGLAILARERPVDESAK